MNDQASMSNGAAAGNCPHQTGPRVTVVGSINMDLAIHAATIPVPGQTVLGSSLSTIPGGKGANQAVAAARCRGRVSIIGRVGNDDFGQRLLLELQTKGVDTTGVMVSETVGTGTAIVMVDNNGDNAICVAAGANNLLRPDDIDEKVELITTADIVMLQLEIPQDTAVYAMQLARRNGIPVVLNPSPVPEMVNPALFEADILILNQNETAQLCGEPADNVREAKLAGSALVSRGVSTVVVTLGRRGAVSITTDEIINIAPFSAKVVDTTGAGDAFTAGFMVGSLRRLPDMECARLANQTAARFLEEKARFIQ